LLQQVMDGAFTVSPDALASVKGHFYLLAASQLLHVAVRSGELQSQFVQGVLAALPQHPRPSIQKLLQQVCGSFTGQQYLPLPSDERSSASTFIDQTRGAWSALSDSSHWSHHLLQRHLMYSLCARHDVPLSDDVVRTLVGDLHSQVPALREFSRTALVSLFSIHQERETLSSGKDASRDTQSTPATCKSLVMEALASPELTSRLFDHLTEDHLSESAPTQAFGFDLSRVPRALQMLIQHGMAQATKQGSNERHHLTQQVINVVAEINVAPRWPPVVQPSLLSDAFDPMNANLASLWADAILSDHSDTYTDTWTNPPRAFASSEHRKEQLFATELLAGFLRRYFLSPRPDSRLWKDTLEPLLHSLFAGEMGTGADWPAALRFSMTGLSPSQYLPSLQHVLEQCGVLSATESAVFTFLEQSDSVSSYKLIRVLLAVRAVVVEGRGHQESIALNQQIARAARRFMDHPNALVRAEIAQLLAESLSQLLAEQQSIAPFLPSLQWTEEQSASPDHTECVLLWLYDLFQRDTFPRDLAGQDELVSFLPSAVNFVLHGVVDANNNVQQHARTCFALMAQSILTASDFQRTFEMLRTHLTAQDWHIRRALLPYVQIADFNHRFVVAKSVHEQVHEMCIKLLADTQIEVRELSAITLNSLLRGWSEDYLKGLGERFQKAARTKLSGDQPLHPTSKRFGVKHGGVLGLAALLLIFPYELPRFVVPWLMELATYIDAHSTIATTVKTTVKDFRRTHNEMWHIYSTQVLTYEENQILQELLVSPSYYA